MSSYEAKARDRLVDALSRLMAELEIEAVLLQSLYGSLIFFEKLHHPISMFNKCRSKTHKMPQL